MFNINGLELLLLAVMFLILFGPDRLPSVVVDLMNVVRQLRAAAEAATEDLTREFQAAARDLRDVQQAVTDAGTDVKQAVEGVGIEARRAADEAAGNPRIAPPALLAAAEAVADSDDAPAPAEGRANDEVDAVDGVASEREVGDGDGGGGTT